MAARNAADDGDVAFQPTGKHAAMHRKPCDRIHHRLGRDIDRHVLRHEGHQFGQRCDPVLCKEHTFQRKTSPTQRCLQRYFALDDEARAMT